MPILVLVLLAGFAPLVFFGWLRLDRLVDRLAEARPGTRVRRAVARQIGATIGWYLLYVGLTISVLGGGAVGSGPFLALGFLLVVLAVVAKHRNDAPLFWAAP